MRTYRRSKIGQVFFFTLVTHQRQKILTSDLGRDALRTAFHEVREIHPFTLTAIVLLPDHLHMVWELPRDDTNYSTRIRRIKSIFTRYWRSHSSSEGTITKSRHKKGERGLWQRRFWEHTCRDEDDLKRCIDYIHVNPLKHGLVEAVKDWPWSSFHRYVKLGEYTQDWGNASNWYGDEFKNAE